MSTHEPELVTVHEHPEVTVLLMTVAEVSAAFGVSVSTVRRLLAENKLPNASKRKGPKGDEWVIVPDDMVTLGYRLADPQAKEGRSGHDPVAEAVGALVEEQRADYERKLAEQEQRHAELLAALKGQHQAEVERHQAEVEKLTERAEHERELREAKEQTLNVLTVLVGQTRAGRRALARSGQLELESTAAKRRWRGKQTKQEPSE